MKVPIEGGASQQVSDLSLPVNFDISSDGKVAVFVTFEHVGEHTEKLALVSLDSSHALAHAGTATRTNR